MNAVWIEPSFALRLTTALLHFLWQGCAAGGLVVIGSVLLRRAPARWRYALNVLALLLMVACVPATFVLLDGPDLTSTSEQPTATALTAAPTFHDVETPLHAFAGGGHLVTEPAPLETAREGSRRELESPAGTMLADMTLFARFFTGVYFIGVALMLLRFATALRGGYRLARTAIPIADDALLATIRRQARRIGLRTAPATAWCREISIPVVVGIVRPMVLLPAALASGLSPDQLRALIAHELAHIRRFDPLINILQRLVEALLFFHPAVWFVSRRISLERENAADDMVLAAGWRPPQYADALLRMAELSSALRNTGVAHQAATLAASGTNPSDFKRRILRLVDGPEPTSFRLSRGGLAALVILLLIPLSVPVTMRTLAQAPPTEQREVEHADPPVFTPAEESDPSGPIDKTRLPIVADNFSQQTQVLGNYVTGGGIIERIEDNTIHFRSGDRIEVAAETWLVVTAAEDQPLRRLKLKPELLDPGMAISYSMRDGNIEEVFLTGIVASPPTDKSVFDTIAKLGLRRGSEMSTSLDGRFPMRVTGKDGPVLIILGTTKLIKLPEPTEIVEWQIGDYQPEGVEDFEPFDYLLVQWRENGRITMTCYQSPEVAAANGDSEHARTLINKARGDIRDADVAETDEERGAHQEHARQLIEEARTLFEAALAKHEAEFRKFPLVIPAGDARRPARDEAEQKYLRAKLDLAETVYYETQTWERGSERRNQVLERAVDGFRQIHNAYRSQIVGLIARLWQGRCFQEMDQIREALGIYNELLDHPGTSESMKVLQTHALRYRLICLNHESRRDYRLVIVEGERWREEAGPAAESDAGLGILFEVARAQEQLGGDRTVPEAQRIEYLNQALENARPVAGHEGELQEAARDLMERVSAALDRDEDDVEADAVLNDEAAETGSPGITAAATRLVYVIDNSYSMANNNALQAAKSELAASLQLLNRTQQFQIIFGNSDGIQVLPPQNGRLDLFRGTNGQRHEAARQYRDIQAEGGTEHYPALKRAFEFDSDVVVFMTDGAEPALSARDRASLLTTSPHTRIHCIEFARGAQPSASWLQRLAGEMRGTYAYKSLPLAGNTQLDPAS